MCENPTVVEAAADALGGGCPPLLCTDGVASAAATDLVGGLANSGARLAVRADVDLNGLVTVDQLLAAAPHARLWRFQAKDYARYHALPDAPEASADAADEVRQLRDLYRRCGSPLHEEAILDALLDDLTSTSTRRGPAS